MTITLDGRKLDQQAAPVKTALGAGRKKQERGKDARPKRTGWRVRAGSKEFIAPEVVERVLKLLDFTALGSGALVVLMQLLGQGGAYAAVAAGMLALFHAFLTLWALRETGHYRIPVLLKPLRGVGAGLGVLLTTGVITAVIGWYAFGLPAVDWLQAWALFAVIWLPGSRLVVALWAWPKEKAGAFRRHVVIVGGGAAAQRAIDTLERSAGLDVEILGLFDDREDDRSPDHIRRYSKLGRIADLAAFARENRVDLVIVAIPLSAEKRLLQMLERLWELPVDIRISALESELKLSPRAYDHLGDLPLLAVFDRPLSEWDAFVKAAFDRVVAALLLVLFAPVMAVVALAIRLESRGPVIFRQKRYGFNNELIEVWKFRSMYVDRCDANASKLVTKDDPRVTKVGRFIRKTSLDELPQLINVLKGDLSLVGPRPHATQAKAADKLYEQVVHGYFARHKVKPGITGWAQINGWRGETDTEEKIRMRVKYDLEYINNWSVWFDLYILLKTPIALLSPANKENAY